ncbi:MAG: CBS domain-containing protein [Candidatus Limivicinus sp.]|jgi:CBS domain-containing protein
MNIAKIMTPKVCTVFLHEKNTVRLGYETMKQRGFTAIPVIDEEGHYIGCVTEGDFLRYLAEGQGRSLKDKTSIGDIIRKDFCRPVHIDADEDEVTNAVLNQNFVPVVDSLDSLCGIVTRKKFIEFLAGRLD